jgi:hypothetical protein
MDIPDRSFDIQYSTEENVSLEKLNMGKVFLIVRAPDVFYTQRDYNIMLETNTVLYIPARNFANSLFTFLHTLFLKNTQKSFFLCLLGAFDHERNRIRNRGSGVAQSLSSREIEESIPPGWE